MNVLGKLSMDVWGSVVQSMATLQNLATACEDVMARLSTAFVVIGESVEEVWKHIVISRQNTKMLVTYVSGSYNEYWLHQGHLSQTQ